VAVTVTGVLAVTPADDKASVRVGALLPGPKGELPASPPPPPHPARTKGTRTAMKAEARRDRREVFMGDGIPIRLGYRG
jgi:hypothetical protein